MVILRDYQQKGVDDIRSSFKSGKKCPLYVLPTGAGKTVVFCHIAAQAFARGKRVLILVHRIELLQQTSAALNKSGVPHGLISPNYTPDITELVQIASVQTMIKRLDKIIPPDLYVVDEAHHSNAGSWKKIIDTYSSARGLGVTATPCRGDGRGLGIDAGGVFDDLILGPQIHDLINAGHLVAPIVYAPPTKLDLSSIRIVRGDFDSKEVAQAIDKPKIIGDTVAHYRKLCDGVPAVAFCASVKHAEHVADAFREAGYKAYSVDGAMDNDMRSQILAGLGDGSVDIVTSCDLISEGTDIPAIGCAILLRPTQSLGLFLQQVGRALRPFAGKKNAIVLDHVGNVLLHGLPDEEREWSLEGKKRRGRSSINAGAVIMQQCSECFAVFEPAGKCPGCGAFVRKLKQDIPDQVDGELREITPAEMAAIKLHRLELVEQAKSLEKSWDTNMAGPCMYIMPEKNRRGKT